MKSTGAFLKKPTGNWQEWAAEEEEGEEEDTGSTGSKDYSVPTRQQCLVFSKKLELPDGAPGALPQGAKEHWNSLQGP